MADPLDNQTRDEQLRRLLLHEEQARLDQLEARLGDEEALKNSLVPVIADVLRDAGVRDYRQLAGALAPVVLQSIKTEIHNSRDMMVDALYPITGRLVAAAVRNAFRDLVEQLNQKLDSSLSFDRWRTIIKAKVTGRSEAEILLSEGAAFEITDLLLIHRETGLLIAQAGQDSDRGGLDSRLLGSVLTAIMAFVRDAMHESPEQDLRTLHVGDMRLHLQASPGAILAVKTKGPPPPGFDSALNNTFCAFLAAWGEEIADPESLDKQQEIALVESLEEQFQGLLKAKRENFKGPSRKGVILLGCIGALIIGFLGWHLVELWQKARHEQLARAVIAEMPSLTGYPLRVRYQNEGETVTVIGLVPSSVVEEQLKTSLRKVLPQTELVFQTQALPSFGVPSLDNPMTGDDRMAVDGYVEDALERYVDKKVYVLEEAIARVETALPPEGLRKLGAFESWLRLQALQFSGGVRLSDAERARSVLQDIASRFQGMPDDILLLVIGHGDEVGGSLTSVRVSLERAGMVSRLLEDLGIASSRLITVGRGNESRISEEAGPGSANRRVVFELIHQDQVDVPAADDQLRGR